ncbi:MAG: chemotaxis protein CheD [Peptococcaceae bacterium]|nr:chemotaxis protein CheD [Peptococcaceae bacterium]
MEQTTIEIQVGIADYKTTKNPNRLITLGLGSCVGVTLYDPVARVGGLLHVMLPDSNSFKDISKPAKFADLGIPLMIKEINNIGGALYRLKAKLVGGAQMFSGLDSKLSLNIGLRNTERSREVLKEMGIPIVSEDVGGNKGRTIILDTSTGDLMVRTLGTNVQVI